MRLKFTCLQLHFYFNHINGTRDRELYSSPSTSRPEDIAVRGPLLAFGQVAKSVGVHPKKQRIESSGGQQREAHALVKAFQLEKENKPNKKVNCNKF